MTPNEGRERGEKYRLRHRAPRRLEAVNDGDQDVLRAAGAVETDEPCL